MTNEWTQLLQMGDFMSGNWDHSPHCNRTFIGQKQSVIVMYTEKIIVENKIVHLCIIQKEKFYLKGINHSIYTIQMITISNYNN